MNEPLTILNNEPFNLKQAEKEALFLSAMRLSARFHYQNCPEFKIFCDNKQFDVFSEFQLNDLPYLPVSIFKKFDLLSVPKNQIIKTLYSSSTSGEPSKIMLDKITADNQALALNKIMSNFLGRQRRHFFVFDSEQTVKSASGELSSRGTAIRGMVSLAKKMSFLLDEYLELSLDKLKSALSQVAPEEKICYFGFTWLIYNIFLKNKDNQEVRDAFLANNNQDSLILHIGGWKKLKDLAVSKPEFNASVGEMLNVAQDRVKDFYGLTEQLGTVYPDCAYGYKHLPLYSEMIIRDVNTLEPLPQGAVGFFQFLSPLPHSYPGISILTDDLGRVAGVDDCLCGRKGKYFIFEKRSEKAELKGCGDTLRI